MSTVRVPAYLSAPDDAVRANPWLVREGDLVEPLGDEYDGFDPAAMLALSCRVFLDQRRIRRACGLGDGDRVGVVGLWSSSSTRLRGASRPEVLAEDAGEATVDLSLALESHSLGGTLVLRTAVILVTRHHDPAPLVPNLLGSVLWEAREPQRVDLEGAATRFPTELREFGRGNSFPPGAAWILDWEPGDLSLPVLGSVRLYMNATHPVMPGLAAGARDPASVVILEALKFDIARQLLTGAFRNPEFVRDSLGYEDGTVGATLRRLCTRVLFPYESIEVVAHRATRDPARFEAELQAGLRLFARALS